MAVTDESLEPLFNRSTEGSGSNKRLAFSPVNTAGAADHRTAITVTETAQEITITTNKRTIMIQNTGTSRIYYGGSGVTSSNGIILFPNQLQPFSNVQDTWSIYAVCAAGETSTLRIVEFD